MRSGIVVNPAVEPYGARVWRYDGVRLSGPINVRDLQVTPPDGSGPGWSYAYEGFPDSASSAMTVTTPQGGTIRFEMEPQAFTVVDPAANPPETGTLFTPVVKRRITGGREVVSGTWTYTYTPFGSTNPQSYKTTIESPSGIRTTFVYSGLGEEILVPNEPPLPPPSDSGPTLSWNEGAVLLSRTVEGPGGEEERLWYHNVPHVQGTTSYEIGLRRITRGGHTYSTSYSYHAFGYGDFHTPYLVEEAGEAERRTTREFDYSLAPGYGFLAEDDADGHPSFIAKLRSETVTVDNNSFTRTWTYEPGTGFTRSESTYGLVTTYTPDGTGNVARVTKGNGTYTDFKYAWGIVSEIANPQFTVTREVNEDGTVRSETRGGRTTTFEYDGLFRVTKSQPPAANAFVTAYAPAGDTITMTRGPSRTVTTVDGFGRPIRVQTETGSGVIVTSTSYDADGRTVFESLPAYGGTGPGTELVYDPLGRVRQQWPHGADGARLSTHVEIDRSTAGRVSIADENGRTTTQDWAAFGNPDEGRLVAVTDAGQETWRYSYNALGTLTYVDAPGDADRSWVYDSHNLLRSESHPESGTTFYDDYDGAGNLRHTRDANNIGTSYEYDDAERLSRVTSDQRVTTFTYAHGAEERRTASVGGIVSTFGYDDAGRLRRRVDVIPGSNTLVQQLDYDGNDNLIRLEYPSGRVATFAYDQANRVISIATAASSDASPANFAWNFSYHPSGAILSYRTANNLDHVFEYEPSRYRLTRIAAGALQLHYSDYDAVGNVRRIDDGRTGTSQVFTYDGLDRLQEASGPYGSMRFDYDAHGNRMSNAFGSYDYDTRFRLRSDGPNRTYTYDDNGNLKTGPYGGDSYDYTPDNLLSASTVAGQTTAYRYDGDGWRIARTDSNGAVSTFARGANGQLLSEVRSTGIHRDYVYAGSRLIGMIRKVVDTSKPLVAQEPPEANPDGPRLGLNFTASSRNSAPLMTADLARAAATTACTTGETSGCAWSSVASVTAPTNTLAWVPSAPLVDTAPPIGVAMLYQVRVTDREGITGEGEPAEVEIAADTLPDAFTFADRADVELNTVIESNVVRIAGVTGSASVSVAGALFRVCADSACGDNPSFTAASGTVSSGSYLQLRVTSSGSYGTGVTATLTVGTGGASWIVTTRMPDSTPDPFSFTDRTGVGLSTTVQSNIVQVSGITDQVSISIAGAGTYRICSDTTCASSPAFTAAPQTIANGAYVQLQATSSASYGTASSATLTVGTVSDTWSVTTGAAPAVVLTTTRTGSGQGTISGSGINCGATCQQTLPAGTAVSLTATPGSGYVFAGWSGGGCTGTGTCHFTIAANVTVTAAFNCTRPTGGTITAAGGYTLHTFTANGTFNAGSCINNVQYLIVGAGGSGGDLRGGGGGGGGVLTGSVAVSATSYSVVVGLGNSGSNGGNSSAFGKTATGGGRGANEGGNGASGGSGGGGSGPGTSGGAGVSGQGYAGGGGELDGDHVAGGGGGGAGGTGTQGWWGPGGPGRQVWGVYYGGGGGGNEDIGSGSGGIGGGGDGGAGGNPSTQGADHLGGGGGGGESKRGGHGVVIVRYPSL